MFENFHIELLFKLIDLSQSIKGKILNTIFFLFFFKRVIIDNRKSRKLEIMEGKLDFRIYSTSLIGTIL